MNYTEFRQRMKSFPIFSIREIEKQFPCFDRRRLVEWQEKRYIQKLRNRYYCFTDRRVEEPFLYYTANELYRPSYLSLESALSRYGFIPEGVFRIISCTTLKTCIFETPVGIFGYHHLKANMFFGYRLESWGDHHYTIAEPEKTLIDYLYLHPEIKRLEDFRSLRWNVLTIKEQISMEKLSSYESYIASSALSKRLSVLKEFLDVKT